MKKTLLMAAMLVLAGCGEKKADSMPRRIPPRWRLLRPRPTPAWA